MSALDGRNAVDLDKADFFDQRLQALAIEFAVGRGGEALSFNEEPPRGPVVEGERPA